MHLTTIPTLHPCTGNSLEVLSWKSRIEISSNSFLPLVLWLFKTMEERVVIKKAICTFVFMIYVKFEDKNIFLKIRSQ